MVRCLAFSFNEAKSNDLNKPSMGSVLLKPSDTNATVISSMSFFDA